MVEERSFRFYRRILILFNVFYFLLALTFLFLALFTRFRSSIIDLHLLIGLIVSSIYLILVSSFGLYAVVKHHQVFLFFYLILLSILFIFQFTLACTYLFMRSEKKSELIKNNYEQNRDLIQDKYQCCLYDNQTLISNRTEICGKLSCCTTVDKCCETLPMCYVLLKDELDKNLKTVGSLMLILTLTEIFAVYVTLRFRNLRDPTALFI